MDSERNSSPHPITFYLLGKGDSPRNPMSLYTLRKDSSWYPISFLRSRKEDSSWNLIIPYTLRNSSDILIAESSQNPISLYILRKEDSSRAQGGVVSESYFSLYIDELLGYIDRGILSGSYFPLYIEEILFPSIH